MSGSENYIDSLESVRMSKLGPPVDIKKIHGLLIVLVLRIVCVNFSWLPYILILFVSRRNKNSRLFGTKFFISSWWSCYFPALDSWNLNSTFKNLWGCFVEFEYVLCRLVDPTSILFILLTHFCDCYKICAFDNKPEKSWFLPSFFCAKTLVHAPESCKHAGQHVEIFLKHLNGAFFSKKKAFERSSRRWIINTVLAMWETDNRSLVHMAIIYLNVGYLVLFLPFTVNFSLFRFGVVFLFTPLLTESL